MGGDHFKVERKHFKEDDDHFSDHFELDGAYFEADDVHCKVHGKHFEAGLKGGIRVCNFGKIDFFVLSYS